MGTTRRRRGTGTIIQEGRGWALRIGRKAGARRYISGFASREAAEDAALAIAGQDILSRMMRAASPTPAAEGASFGWAEERWGDMNHRERQAVAFARFNGRCIYCGRTVSIPTRREVGRPDRAVMDHRIPVAGGGADSFANVVLSCHGCNAKKLDEPAP